MPLLHRIAVQPLLDVLVREPADDGADEAADEDGGGLTLVEAVGDGEDVGDGADEEEDHCGR